ncbi:LETM1-like protein [Nitzschia inconspicua]|uniref:LETM1-like protein n=1 Tax=Nitzschia inconspicua TaxID=303405 RepID=A0A9K3LQP2_9STRA|nr:LETM1-like protein [Nitzschia inconspicua]
MFRSVVKRGFQGRRRLLDEGTSRATVSDVLASRWLCARRNGIGTSTLARASLSHLSSSSGVSGRSRNDTKVTADASSDLLMNQLSPVIKNLQTDLSVPSLRSILSPTFSIKRHALVTRAQYSTLSSPFSTMATSSYWRYQQRLNDSFFRKDSRVLMSSATPSDDESSKPKNKKKSSPPVGLAYATHAKIPTPKSSPHAPSIRQSIEAIDPKAILKTILTMTWNITKTVLKFLLHLPYNTYFYATHAQERREKLTEIKEIAKKEFDHYKVGTKLLIADVQTARSLVGKTLGGSTLTRRERKQLLRTVSDLFRLVPFSMFLIIPFMEFALPFALRIFPNMLPSTFQDSLKAEETMKRELQSRIAMAQFFQETMEELAKEQKRIAANRRKHGEEEAVEDSIAKKQEASATDMLEFLDRARNGEMIPADVIIQYANYFQDDLTLDNMPRMQLINMCKYMSIAPYGADSFLRFQLRHRIRLLKEDDQRILWEGIDSLTKMELREACQERGMRSTGLSKEAYKKNLQQWLDLSVNKNVPISLLIMSRTFFLQEEITSPESAASSDESSRVAGLADAISGMDKEVLNEVILQVATADERKSDLDVRKIQLEVLTQQNEKIKEEQAERERKKKESESSATSSEDEDKEPLKAAMSPVDVGSMSEKDIMEKFDKKVDQLKEELVEKAAELETGERELSTEEMEAISQLLSADPVFKEREDLARIKGAMKKKIQEAQAQKEAVKEEKVDSTDKVKEVLESSADDEIKATNTINEMETKAAEEAKKLTSFSTSINNIDANKSGETASTVPEEEEEEEEAHEDPVVARLKRRIESMVDKIENQLSDAHIKIGEKLHYLDKDMDGILSRQEMAEVLSQVFKNISFEEALEIADGIDENKDGVFTVQELIQWIETNKLVKFESEGRDADMDKIMESHSSEKDSDEIAQAESSKNSLDEASKKTQSSKK